MVHAFTCAGMLPVQYKNMTTFAKIGSVGERYISHGISPLSHSITSHYCWYYYYNLVYRTAGYMECINAAVENPWWQQWKKLKDCHIMQIITVSEAIHNIVFYIIQWVITDARHESTANAYHKNVPCIAGRYNKI